MSKIQVDTIDTRSGTSTMTVGSTNTTTVSIPKAVTLGASGTTVTIPSGATITNSGTATGFGENNNPSFSARMSAHQALGDNVTTKVAYDTVDYQTSGTYDTSNYRFTPGVAGNYQFQIQVVADSQATANLYAVIVKLYKNGSVISEQSDGVIANFVDNYPRQMPITFNCVSTSDTNDYFEVYTAINDTSGTPQIQRYGSWFTGFKITESA